MPFHPPPGHEILFLLVAPFWLMGEGIIGSKHDFSSQPWNTAGDVCTPCHTPHSKADTPIPLWNHSLSNATYQLYSSDSLWATPEQPRGVSRLCLGCHDGTVALDSFGGQTGTHFISGTAKIGTDLTADHPISIRWTHKGARNCIDCHYSHGQPFSSPVPFYEGRVECATCHDPHDVTPLNPAGTHMLRLSMTQSTLCQLCHIR